LLRLLQLGDELEHFNGDGLRCHVGIETTELGIEPSVKDGRRAAAFVRARRGTLRGNHVTLHAFIVVVIVAH